MTSNKGDLWQSCALSICLALSGSPTEDWPVCVIFYKLFPASAAFMFKMGLIKFIVEMSQELKIYVKNLDFMMAELPWAVIWGVASHKAVILQGQWKCHYTRASWVIYLILLGLWQWE